MAGSATSAPLRASPLPVRTLPEPSSNHLPLCPSPDLAAECRFRFEHQAVLLLGAPREEPEAEATDAGLGAAARRRSTPDVARPPTPDAGALEAICASVLSLIDAALKEERRDAAVALAARHRELAANLANIVGVGCVRAGEAVTAPRPMSPAWNAHSEWLGDPQLLELASEKGQKPLRQSLNFGEAKIHVNSKMTRSKTDKVITDSETEVVDADDDDDDPLSEQLTANEDLPSRRASYWNTLAQVQKSKSKLSFAEHKEEVPHELTGTEPGRRLEKIVSGTKFELIFSVLIFANTVILAFEGHYKGMIAGNIILYPEYETAAENRWPRADVALEVIDIFFGVIFTVELILKIITLRTKFVEELWNWVDFVIVVAWLLTSLEFLDLPLDPMLLRLARLARLLRLLRLVRTIKGFDKLYVMTTAIKGSLSALAWSAILLVMVQMMIALCLQAMVEPYITDDNPDTLQRRQEVFMFYGTFARCMLTMFEITLGNWMPPCRALVENVHEGYMLFSLAHKMIIGFSVVSVITGVFIQETFKVTTRDDKVMLAQKEQAALAHATKMQALFRHADTDHSGKLDREEFREVIRDNHIRTWLAAMELDVMDADQLFNLIHDRNGQVTAKEFVRGTGRLKGASRSIDLVTLMKEQRETRSMLQLVLDRVGHADVTTVRSRLA